MIFHDDFETGDQSAWDDESAESEVTTDPALVFNGRWSLRAHWKADVSRAGGPIKWFMPGYQEIYVRWYLMFEPGFDVRHGMHHMRVKGNHVNDKWTGFAGAGEKPTGFDRFSVGVDPYTIWNQYSNPGFLVFYSYFADMKIDPDGSYWGNVTYPEDRTTLKHGKWYCVEIRVKVNDVGEKNGIQELWLDGVKKISDTDMMLRESDELLCNAIFCCFYQTFAPTKPQQMVVDEVVVSHEYIGPLEGAK
ncbi:polysaccharide lyase [candidate division KSB1 bacterium]